MEKEPPSYAIKHSSRFVVISIAGLGIDISIAWILIDRFGFSDWVGASIGFFVATTANYVGHQLWTFREHSKGLSWFRFIQFSGVVMFTLVARLGALSFAGMLLPGDSWRIPARLLFAATVSFSITFMLSQKFVFRSKS
jgi:putative flippase GtrA